MMTAKFVGRNARAFGGLVATLTFLFTIATADEQDDKLREPPTVKSENGKLSSPLMVLFGTVNVPTPKSSANINVRAYGLLPPDKNDPAKTTPLVPGPTFVFRPGDLLKLHLHNFLNRSSNPALNSFENQPQEAAPGIADDIIGHAAHEISIPNNADITNLHVHGLHVDPKQDNVTLLVLPEDSNPSNLVPELQRLVPTINRWWTRPYQYKIPADHVPGTFWYHAHKHGSTATQVENGMAGTLLMLPNNDADSIVPGLWNDDQTKTHDRVLVLQGIMNFGTPQGEGKGPLPFSQSNLGTPVPTTNGQFQPTLKLPAGQLERWRFIFAGANHRAVGSLWVGKIVPKTLPADLRTALKAITNQAQAELYYNPPPKTLKSKFPNTPLISSCIKIPGRVKLVAVDGVPMWRAVDISPSSPTFGAAGNRNDLLIQVDPSAASSGPYYTYQNYPLVLSDLASAKETADLFGPQAGDAAQWRYTAMLKGKTKSGSVAYTFVDEASKPVPNAMTTDPYDLHTDYQSLKKAWANVDEDGNFTSSSQQSIGPLLNGNADPKTHLVKANIRATLFPNGIGWQPMGAGTGQPAGANIVMNLDISGTAEGPQMPTDEALNARLSQLSPASHEFDVKTTKLKRLNKHGQLVAGIPSYVAPITDADLSGQQVIIFDRGQFTFDYIDKSNGTTLQFRQFWLNGRQFSPDDFVGNPDSTRLIQSSLENVEPSLGKYSPNAAESLWTHRVGTGLSQKLLITNPGYYQALTTLKSADGTDSGYNYTKASLDKPPTYLDVTGLDQPRQPESTTAEEWLLINNSDMYHPFHIHISPFFVTEVGQLNYDASSKDQPWMLKNLSDSDSPFQWVAGNWWDVILLPPHGYVKMRTWLNVPIQLPANSNDEHSDLVAVENANVYGSWVLHCHILRHEDRGMMTMVNTRPKPASLSGKWFGATGPAMEMIDDQGGLVVNGMPNTTILGTFNQGLGNPFKSQPWAGAMSFTTANGATTKTFNVTDNIAEIVFSDGTRWSKKQQPLSPAVTPINLSGNWVDSDANVAAITQVLDPATNAYNLTFTPKSSPPVWWGSGKGSWPAGVIPSGGTNALSFAGTQTLVNNAGQNQQLTFTVTADGQSIVFGNGIKWTRK